MADEVSEVSGQEGEELGRRINESFARNKKALSELGANSYEAAVIVGNEVRSIIDEP